MIVEQVVVGTLKYEVCNPLFFKERSENVSLESEKWCIGYYKITLSFVLRILRIVYSLLILLIGVFYRVQPYRLFGSSS